MRCDYHIHSFYSDDSIEPAENMILRAIELGLDEICFTEHADYDVPGVVCCDYDAYFKGIEELREKYAGRISIKRGIELGVEPRTVGYYRDVACRYPFDFIIMSCHQLDGEEFCKYLPQRGRSQKEYQEAYYEAVLAAQDCFGEYSVLGHLDMIKRYETAPEPYPDEEILPLAERIFRKAIADGKGIEVNTSGFRYGLGDNMPSRRLLELYYSLGGRIITIGSDAHTAKDLGAHTDEARSLLREIGFKEFCAFERLEPVFHRL